MGPCRCPICNGDPGPTVSCHGCNGRGVVWKPRCISAPQPEAPEEMRLFAWSPMVSRMCILGHRVRARIKRKNGNG